MKTKELVLYNCSEREEVEEVSEALPHVGVAILPGALVVETIDLSDLS